MYERIERIYEKYRNVDINLAIYLEKHGLDLDTYNCHDFIMWEKQKEKEFNERHIESHEKLQTMFLNYLLNS